MLQVPRNVSTWDFGFAVLVHPLAGKCIYGGGFPKLGVSYWGFSIIRIIVFWGIFRVCIGVPLFREATISHDRPIWNAYVRFCALRIGGNKHWTT